MNDDFPPGLWDTDTVTFFVPSQPATKGSWNVSKSGGLYPNNKGLKAWALMVSMHARHAMGANPPFPGPCRIDRTYYLRRPKEHLRKDGTVLPGAPMLHDKKLDADKLDRAIYDALSSVCWVDDGQAQSGEFAKLWAEPGREGVAITITRLPQICHSDSGTTSSEPRTSTSRASSLITPPRFSSRRPGRARRSSP